MSSKKLNLFLGAFGDPGHAFPMIALGKELITRGHRVTLQTWQRWQSDVEAEGIAFTPAPEYQVFPTEDKTGSPFQAVVAATEQTAPLLRDLAPDAVIADILTLAPKLAAELCEVPAATLIPHLYPVATSGMPPFSSGTRLPRTALGRSLWQALEPLVNRGLKQGRNDINYSRNRLGLKPVENFHSGISDELCLVGSLPMLEYPRQLPEHVKIVGPLQWQPTSPPSALDITSDIPLVLIAPSTSQDPQHKLIHTALEALADLPIRVVASWNSKPPTTQPQIPKNAQLVEWISYSDVLPHCSAVITHGGHGTLMRALTEGVPAVVCPVAGDMFENATRIAWADLGVRIPPISQRTKTLRTATKQVLTSQKIKANVNATAAWISNNNGATYAAELIEAKFS